ncbi:cell wall hydrolase [Bacillus licheniformis]|uniref:cell wall hydrolase n=1 Tax=Bacillus licheniformis TaxID=1402 RepID=UPI00237CD5E4|nr:cell wall hydrolase [Bacillus licheniformis]MDE1381224.1 cell wall hydrolase [Bacillus licheniformis]
MFKKLSALALAGAVSFGVVSPAMAYEVKSGDTMYKVATQHNMSLQELASLNPQVKNLDLIYIGQNLNTNKNDGKVNKKVNTKVKVNTNVNTSSEVDLLARLVRAEAESEPYSGKVAVAEVVLNRVESSQFPNSIYDVIYQSGQFSPVSNGSINQPADSESIQAAKQALGSGSNIGDALFFYNPATATNHWLDSKATKAVIGNHVFK